MKKRNFDTSFLENIKLKKTKNKKKCEYGNKCKYINEYQHSLEFSHDHDSIMINKQNSSENIFNKPGRKLGQYETLDNNHFNSTYNDDDLPIKCEICSSYISIDQLDIHMLSHDNQIQYPFDYTTHNNYNSNNYGNNYNNNYDSNYDNNYDTNHNSNYANNYNDNYNNSNYNNSNQSNKVYKDDVLLKKQQEDEYEASILFDLEQQQLKGIY